MSFIVWVALLLGGLYCWLTSPEVFDNAHTIGLVAVVIAAVLVVLQLIGLLVFRSFWNKQNDRMDSFHSRHRL